MNQKTDSAPPSHARGFSEFTPGFIWAMVILTLGTLLLVFVVEPPRSFRRYDKIQTISAYPWVTAGGWTVAHGLSEFSGEEPKMPSSADRRGILISLLLGFIVGPTLFIVGWRKSRLIQDQASRPRGFYIHHIAFILGGIMTFAVAAPSILSAIAQQVVSGKMRSEQAVASNRDFVIHDLNRISKNILQYRIMPVQAGGGGGSYEGYKPGEGLDKSEHAQYEVFVDSPDLVVIIARSLKYEDAGVTVTVNKEGRLTDWRYDGQFQ